MQTQPFLCRRPFGMSDWLRSAGETLVLHPLLTTYWLFRQHGTILFMFAKNLWSKGKVREVLPLSPLTTHPTSFQLDIWGFIERIFAIQWGAVTSLFSFRTTIVYKTTWKEQLWNPIPDRPCSQYKVTLALSPAEVPVADASPRTQVPAHWATPALGSCCSQYNCCFRKTRENSTAKLCQDWFCHECSPMSLQHGKVLGWWGFLLKFKVHKVRESDRLCYFTILSYQICKAFNDPSLPQWL